MIGGIVSLRLKLRHFSRRGNQMTECICEVMLPITQALSQTKTKLTTPHTLIIVSLASIVIKELHELSLVKNQSIYLFR